MIVVGSASELFAQNMSDNPAYVSYKKEYAELKLEEGALSEKLAASRKLFEGGTSEEKKSAAADIVRLESEIYDLKANISKLSSRITAIEQDFATQSLMKVDNAKSERRGFYLNNIFTKNLAQKHLVTLSTGAKVEQAVLKGSLLVKGLYAQLKSLKVAYDLARSQSELDRIKSEATDIKSQIIVADRQACATWDSLYNFKADTYLALVDKLDDMDRATNEMLESQAREARRAETFAQALLAPQILVFEAQRKHLRSYERVIAKSEKLILALDSLERIKPLIVDLDSMADIQFDPRILTLYGPVTFRKDDMPISKIDEVPDAIIPESGVYYSVQIALMSAAPKDLVMFKGAWPLQVENTSDSKLRYMVGGFSNYADALTAVGKLQKAGYRAPIMVAWVDGKITTQAKAKAYEATQPKGEGTVGSFKIELRTSDSSVGEKIKSLVDMHAKGKNVARVASGKELLFTIAEFDDKYEAQVIAQIIADRTDSKTEVVAIK